MFKTIITTSVSEFQKKSRPMWLFFDMDIDDGYNMFLDMLDIVA